MYSTARPIRPNPTRSDRRRTEFINSVHFDGWSAVFQSSDLIVPSEYLIEQDGGLEHYVLEVAFRLVSSKSSGQTAEIVAVSYDSGKTFYENKLCTLPQEYAQLEETHAG